MLCCAQALRNGPANLHNRAIENCPILPSPPKKPLYGLAYVTESVKLNNGQLSFLFILTLEQNIPIINLLDSSALVLCIALIPVILLARILVGPVMARDSGSCWGSPNWGRQCF